MSHTEGNPWKLNITEHGFTIDAYGKEEDWITITQEQAAVLVRWVENSQQSWRRQAIADCIAVIEESVPWSTNNWLSVDERAAILTSLHALQEVDTPQPQLIEHINLDNP